MDFTALDISDYVDKSYWNYVKCWYIGLRKMWKRGRIFAFVSNIGKLACSQHNFEYFHLVLVIFCIIHKATMTSSSICDVIVLFHCVRLIDMNAKDKHLWDICIIRINNKYCLQNMINVFDITLDNIIISIAKYSTLIFLMAVYLP